VAACVTYTTSNLMTDSTTASSTDGICYSDSYDTYNEPTEEEYYFDYDAAEEMQRFWREQAVRKVKCKSQITQKPLVKRRLMFSASGWTPKIGRFRRREN